MARIFISHSSLDRTQSAQLLVWLKSQGFSSTFLDFDKHTGLAPGADWERTLYREVASADAVILVLTKNWFESKWCFTEFTQARALGLSCNTQGAAFCHRRIGGHIEQRNAVTFDMITVQQVRIAEGDQFTQPFLTLDQRQQAQGVAASIPVMSTNLLSSLAMKLTPRP